MHRIARWSPGIGTLALLIAASVVMPIQAAESASGGSFTSSGSLATARSEHTATILADGAVLVIGGDDGMTLASAELRDPVTGAFRTTGPANQARKWHTSTLLSDGGSVLVIGGLGDNAGNEEDFLASAELWDPGTGLFSPAEPLAEPRIYHTATLLPDGRVLVVGGVRVSIVPLASAELWDPATGSFGPTGALGEARSNHSATLLPDGRVLIIGGAAFTPDGFTVYESAELWDPETGSFSPAGSLAEARMDHSATLLPDGRVLVVGGWERDAQGMIVRSSAEIWEPADLSFEPTASLTEARAYQTATPLPDGRVLVVGGGGVDGEPLSSAEVWDPLRGSFEGAGQLAEARLFHTATLLRDTSVIVVGGTGGADSSRLASAEIWAP